MFKLIRFFLTHGIALALGFALGIYLLPVLTAPEAPSDTEVRSSAEQATFHGDFHRKLPGSDFLHWGEGRISVSEKQISFMGMISPGPDYQLYLTPNLVQTEEEFLMVKDESAKIGAVKTFNNFILDIPQGVDPANYRALVVWCESFGEFITAASYR